MDDVLLKFIHVSDTHVEPEEGEPERREAAIERVKGYADKMEPELFEGIMEHVESERGIGFEYKLSAKASEAFVESVNNLPDPIDFVLHTGDITNYGEPAEYARAKEIFQGLNCPIYYANGNHDKIENLYTGLLDMPASTTPYDHSFEVNGVQIVCIDSSLEEEGRRWFVSESQLEWLKTEINGASDKPLIVGIHHPPYKIDINWLNTFIVTNYEEIHDVLKTALPRLRGVFSGHIHEPLSYVQDGVFYNVVPKTYSLNPGYSIVTVTQSGTLVRHVQY